MDRQLRTLERLGGHFLDVVAGLPTLKVFGRAKAQAAAIREITDRYRRTAIATLRVTFLSSLILELVATISVALVAVAIGLRLLNGQLDLRTALFALVLAPEAYLPLRQLGANYHASAEGMAAAEQVFAVLEAPSPPGGGRAIRSRPRARRISRSRGSSVRYPGRTEPALQRRLADRARRARCSRSPGPSGCGKSTLLGVLLGLVAPEAGSVRVGEVELCRARPRRLAATARLGAAATAPVRRVDRRERPPRAPAASDEQVRAAIAAAGLEETVRRLPRGLETVLGERGAGLSAGERQRVALARAFLRDAPLLLLDEPTASLDGETERGVVEAIRRLARGTHGDPRRPPPRADRARRPRGLARAGGGGGVSAAASERAGRRSSRRAAPRRRCGSRSRSRARRRGGSRSRRCSAPARSPPRSA